MVSKVSITFASRIRPPSDMPSGPAADLNVTVWFEVSTFLCRTVESITHTLPVSYECVVKMKACFGARLQ